MPARNLLCVGSDPRSGAGAAALQRWQAAHGALPRRLASFLLEGGCALGGVWRVQCTAPPATSGCTGPGWFYRKQKQQQIWDMAEPGVGGSRLERRPAAGAAAAPPLPCMYAAPSSRPTNHRPLPAPLTVVGARVPAGWGELSSFSRLVAWLLWLRHHPPSAVWEDYVSLLPQARGPAGARTGTYRQRGGIAGCCAWGWPLTSRHALVRARLPLAGSAHQAC